jgi:serine/threonine protein kinase
MGVVYKARQKSLNRLVAVKMILFSPKANADFIKRFRIEASAAAALQHPNIVAIHEVGVHEGEHFLVMDYVDGPNLAELAKDQPLSAERAARYLRKVAEAIHHAHERGILHRDLKPSNVLIDSNDEPRVTDFGLAKRLGTESQPSTDVTQLTLSGHVLGSPSYMPPEQAIGARGKMSRRSDIYSMGAMLYHLLTGRPPFGGGSMADTLCQVQYQEPVSPRLLNPAVSHDLETICLKCLEKEPEQRYRNAHELAEELERFAEGEPILARPISGSEKVWRWCRRKPALAFTISSLAVVLVVGTGGVFWQWRRALTAEDTARQHLYAGDMNLVQQAIMQGNLGRANTLLEQHIPKPGEIDRRSWEWHYFRREAQSDALAVLTGHVSRVQALAISTDGPPERDARVGGEEGLLRRAVVRRDQDVGRRREQQREREGVEQRHAEQGRDERRAALAEPVPARRNRVGSRHGRFWPSHVGSLASGPVTSGSRMLRGVASKRSDVSR